MFLSVVCSDVTIIAEPTISLIWLACDGGAESDFGIEKKSPAVRRKVPEEKRRH